MYYSSFEALFNVLVTTFHRQKVHLATALLQQEVRSALQIVYGAGEDGAGDNGNVQGTIDYLEAFQHMFDQLNIKVFWNL